MTQYLKRIDRRGRMLRRGWHGRFVGRGGDGTPWSFKEPRLKPWMLECTDTAIQGRIKRARRKTLKRLQRELQQRDAKEVAKLYSYFQGWHGKRAASAFIKWVSANFRATEEDPELASKIRNL